MGSIVLSTLYNTRGLITRPGVWYKKVGHVPPWSSDEFTLAANDHERLRSYPLTAKLLKNASDIDASKIDPLTGNHVRRSPEKVILADKYGEYKTGDILTNSIRLAYALKTECNVKPLDRVAIMTGPEREMIEAFLAIQAVGAVPVPINFVNKPETIAYMFSDSGAKTLIVGADERLVNGAKKLANKGFVKNVISVRDNVDPRFYNYSDLIARKDFDFAHYDNLKQPLGNAPAAVFYTSGTGGSAPRGVVYSYKHIADGTERTTKEFPFRDDDVMFFPVPFYHLSGFVSFVGAMNAGIKLVLSDIPSDSEPGSIPRALDTAIENKITIFPCAPVIGSAVLQEAEDRYEKLDKSLPIDAPERIELLLPSLRLIFSGGSPVSRGLSEQVRGLNEKRTQVGLPEIELINFYAATEFGAISWAKVDLNADYRTVRRNLGKPFDGVEVRSDLDGIFWARTSLQPDHYLNRPELTFMDPADGFMKIGDKIEIQNGDGVNLFFKGRDRKVRGGNISGNETNLEDVQEELVQVENVENACVFCVDDEEESDVLCALIIPQKGKQVTADDIDKALELKNLHRRHRPKAYLFEKYMPRAVINGSGKASPSNAEDVYRLQVIEQLTTIRKHNPRKRLTEIKPFKVDYHLTS